MCPCYASVDCHENTVKFKTADEFTFVLKRGQVLEVGKIISLMKVRLLQKRCIGFLAILWDTT